MTSASAASSSTYQGCNTLLIEAEVKQAGAKADTKQQLMIKKQKLNSLVLYLLISFSVLVQWNLRIKDTWGAELLSSFQRLSFGGRFEPICNL